MQRIILNLIRFLFRNGCDQCPSKCHAGIGRNGDPLVSSALEMIGKVVIAVTLVPLLGYTGVIVAEPIVWIIMVIPLIVKIFKMPELKKTA